MSDGDLLVQDISTESLVIGCIYNRPNLFDEFAELISSEHDFSEPNLKFLYDILYTTYMTTANIDEMAINVTVSIMDGESQKQFTSLGGAKVYNRLSNVAESQSNFKVLYERLKVYNLLRQLRSKGFSVTEDAIAKLKDRPVDFVLKAYEAQLSRIGSSIKGINDSINIGNDIDDVYNQLKIDPDIGVPLPWPIMNNITRGLRNTRLYGSGFGSGQGKSREVIFILAFTSVINQHKACLVVNETYKEEVQITLLVTIVNNVFAPKTGIYVTEEKIATGTCNPDEDEMCRQAAAYIKERSQISFLETNFYDFESLKIVLKRHSLRGCKLFFIDTFKPLRGAGSEGMAEWQQFVYTTERLKRIIGTEAKGGINAFLWTTFQMTDDAIASKILNSSAIANARQIKHSYDFMKLTRILDKKDKEKIRVRLDMPGNPFNGQEQELDPRKTYYLFYIEKNRSAKDKQYLIYEINKDLMTFVELGWAAFGKKKEA
jgi:replicative DNA helicase